MAVGYRGIKTPRDCRLGRSGRRIALQRRPRTCGVCSSMRTGKRALGGGTLESKSVLVMLTNNFPDRSGDSSFIQHEIEQIANVFDRVLVFSFEEPEGLLVPMPANVEYVGPLRRLRRTEALSALSNRATLGRALRAFGNEAKWRADPRYLRLTVGNVITGLRFSEAITKALLARGVSESDSVIAYSFWASNAGLALPFLRSPDGKFLRLHRFDLYELDGSHLPLRASMFSAAQKLLPISDDGKEYLLTNYPELLIDEDVEVLRLGTEDHGLGRRGPRAQEAPIHVVSCSSVVPVKRVADVVPALELLSERRPIHWTHFGEGPLMEELKASAEAASSDSLQIDLRGQTPNEQVIAYYKSHPVDAFINVSDSEGVPVSIMEALSFGIPVVATDAGGTGELVGEDKKTGVLLPLRPDPRLLADAVDEVADRREEFTPREVWKKMADAKANGNKIAQLLGRGHERTTRMKYANGATRKSMLILSFSDISADARVLKQVKEFSKDFEVTTCGYGPKPPHAHHHVRVPDDKVFWAYDRLDLVLHMYKRAYWSNAAVDFAHGALANRQFDVVLANEVDAVPLALSLRPKHGVHADVHEYSPREKEDVLRWRLFVAPFRSWLCRRYLPRCASVTTVSQGVADEYERVFNVKPLISRNATSFHELAPTPTEEPIRLVHSGACLRDRDPMAMIEAVSKANRPVTFDLYLTPNDPSLLEQLKVRAAETSNVTVHDPVPYAQLVETLNRYDVGLFNLAPTTFNYRWALPNKLFDNVQARLAQITSPNPEMKRVINEYELGIVADGYDVSDVTSAIDSLTVEDVERWKQNADNVAQELSSDREVKVWREAVKKMVG